MRRLIDEDGRGLAAASLDRLQLSMVTALSSFSGARAIAAARGLPCLALNRACNLTIRRSHQSG
jgi:hypothetical protein